MKNQQRHLAISLFVLFLLGPLLTACGTTATTPTLPTPPAQSSQQSSESVNVAASEQQPQLIEFYTDW